MKIIMNMPVTGRYNRTQNACERIRPAPLPFDNICYSTHLIERHFQDGYGMFEYDIDIPTRDGNGQVLRSTQMVNVMEEIIRRFAQLPVEEKVVFLQERGALALNDKLEIIG